MYCGLLAVAEVGVADAEGRGHGQSDRLAHETLADALDGPADAVGVRRRHQRLDALAQEVGRDGGVGVDAGYDVAAGLGDSQIESAGGRASRVVDEAQVQAFSAAELFHHLSRAVAGIAVHHQYLEALARVVLLSEAAETGLDVAFLVAHRYEDGDKG